MKPEIIGYLAAILTSAAFVPQAIKVIRTNDTEALSLGMYVTFTTGIILWSVYGFIINDIPIMIANTITTCLALIILYKKIKS